MERKLILGGEQYLPFARSQLKALRASGQRYATRHWLMPGGEKVTVRTRGDEDYLQLEGGPDTVMAMDSGIIDLRTESLGNALIFANGTRQDTDSTTDYLLAYHAADPAAGQWAQWLSWPEGGRAGQFIGSVEVPTFKGHIRADLTRAPSFEAARQPVTPATEPPSWIYNPEDSALSAKKYMASKCPASIFTGRARLYVQALYGRPRYEYGGDTSVEPKSAGLSGFPSLASATPPSLSLPAYRRRDDTETYPAVTIDTSAGVRFDAATGRHWLMVIDGAHLNVYPLLSTRAGEKLRKYLVAGTPVGDDPALGEGDREKLEAYLLAYSLPDVKNKVAVEAGAATSAYSMGYGWHWNWSGTAADTVTSTQFEQGASAQFPGGSQAMESTHRRLSVNMTTTDGVDAWSAARTVVEGPKQWAVSRLFWCVAEPEWSTGAMLKSTPRNSALFECDAPFYAYYMRDELQVCRIAVELIPATTQTRTASTLFADPAYGGSVSGLTAGSLSGFCEDAASVAAHYSATVTCGAASESGLVLGKTSVFARWEVSDKSEPVGIRVPSNDGPLGAGVGYPITYGYDTPWGTLESITVVGPGHISASDIIVTQFTYETSNSEEVESSSITAIVPFFDAQAIFLEATHYTTETRTLQYTSRRASTSFWNGLWWIPSGGAEVCYFTAISGGANTTVLSATSPGDEVIETIDTNKTLNCIAGAVPATMDDLASFHDAEEYAQVAYAARTGVASAQPVAIVHGHGQDVGTTQTVPSYPALVGWV
jgi:hypothetical protein